MSNLELSLPSQFRLGASPVDTQSRGDCAPRIQAIDFRQEPRISRSETYEAAPLWVQAEDDDFEFDSPAYAKILVVEDDPELSSAMKRYLSEKHFLITVTGNGSAAVSILLNSDETYDAVVLDIMLPGLDGREVCRQVRGAGCWVPIVMVTALGESEDRIVGLELGADDYIVKPFSLKELSLRLRALIRRSEATWVSVLQLGELGINLQTRQAWCGEDLLNLTHREFQLLELFLRHPGLVLSRNTIRSAVWGVTDNRAVSNNLIDHHIAHLRRKIDRPSLTSSIETLSRIGYRLRVLDKS